MEEKWTKSRKWKESGRKVENHKENWKNRKGKWKKSGRKIENKKTGKIIRKSGRKVENQRKLEKP